MIRPTGMVDKHRKPDRQSSLATYRQAEKLIRDLCDIGIGNADIRHIGKNRFAVELLDGGD